jgi:ferredoxin
MQSVAEIDYNTALFEGLEPSVELERVTAGVPRALHVHDWCHGCGRCAAACKSGAIRIEGGRAVPDHQKCVLCGYCAAACPEFCIKVL